jgi:TonB family protein
MDATTTNAVEPDYPEMAKEQGAEGTTQVEVSLDAAGNVLSATVHKSAGNALLDQAAIAAAKASKYQPEIVNCVKTAGSYIFRADFTGQ